MFGRAVFEIARKEVLQHIRTKRLLIIGSFFLLALILLTIVVPVAFLDLSPDGSFFGESEFSLENGVLLFFLTGFFFLSGYFYIQLLPLVLTADAVCSEWNSRTIFLLLSKPVSRSAFVLGKFIGSFFTVAVTMVVLLVLDYLLLQPLLPGGPDGSDIAGFAGALGILLLGVGSFTAFALFLSTLTRSTVASMILAITSWIIIFPLLGRLDLFIALARHGSEAFSMTNEEAGIGWSQYLSPAESMDVASNVLVGSTEDIGFLGDFLSGEANVGLSIFALLAQTALFLGLALLVVQRRNFE